MAKGIWKASTNEGLECDRVGEFRVASGRGQELGFARVDPQRPFVLGLYNMFVWAAVIASMLVGGHRY